MTTSMKAVKEVKDSGVSRKIEIFLCNVPGVLADELLIDVAAAVMKIQNAEGLIYNAPLRYSDPPDQKVCSDVAPSFPNPPDEMSIEQAIVATPPEVEELVKEFESTKFEDSKDFYLKDVEAGERRQHFLWDDVWKIDYGRHTAAIINDATGDQVLLRWSDLLEIADWVYDQDDVVYYDTPTKAKHQAEDAERWGYSVEGVDVLSA